MRKVIHQVYKSDQNAEWHPLHTVETDPTWEDDFKEGIICQVCGEVYDVERFNKGEIVKCNDCGLNLELVNIDDGGNYPWYIVIHNSEEKSAWQL
jgi:hypothetical protein